MNQLRKACIDGDLEKIKSILKHVKNPKKNKESVLFSAAKYGYKDIVDWVLEDKTVDVHERDCKAYRYAAEYGHVEIFKDLMKSVNIALLDYYAFKKACRNEHIDIVKILLDSVEPDDLNILVHKGLYQGAKYGKENIVKFLLKSHKDIIENCCISTAVYNGHLNIIKLIRESVGIKAYNFYANYSLSLAGEKGDLEIIKYLQKTGLDVKELAAALHNAIIYGHYDTVEYLLKQDVEASGYYNNNLSNAVYEGHIDIVKLLLEQDDVLLSNDNREFIAAVSKGHLDLVKFFLDLGINIENNLKELLIITTREGQLEVLKFLIEIEHVDINACDDVILNTAAKEGNLDILNYVFKKQTKKNVGKGFNIIEACASGNYDVVKILINKGADIHAQQDKALEKACSNGKLEIVKLLLDNGAIANWGKNRSLQESVSNNYHDNNSYEIIKLLIENGVDVRVENDYPLRRAAYNGEITIAELLIENGAKEGIENEALRNAAYSGYIDMVKFLISQGADPRAKDDYALKTAAVKGREEIFDLLLGYGADIHAENDFSIIQASKNHHPNIVKKLIEKGADISAGDFIALKEASKHGDSENVEILCKMVVEKHKEAIPGIMPELKEHEQSKLKYYLLKSDVIPPEQKYEYEEMCL